MNNILEHDSDYYRDYKDNIFDIIKVCLKRLLPDEKSIDYILGVIRNNRSSEVLDPVIQANIKKYKYKTVTKPVILGSPSVYYTHEQLEKLADRIVYYPEKVFYELLKKYNEVNDLYRLARNKEKYNSVNVKELLMDGAKNKDFDAKMPIVVGLETLYNVKADPTMLDAISNAMLVRYMNDAVNPSYDDLTRLSCFILVTLPMELYRNYDEDNYWNFLNSFASLTDSVNIYIKAYNTYARNNGENIDELINPVELINSYNQQLYNVVMYDHAVNKETIKTFTIITEHMTDDEIVKLMDDKIEACGAALDSDRVKNIKEIMKTLLITSNIPIKGISKILSKEDKKVVSVKTSPKWKQLRNMRRNQKDKNKK